MNGQNDFLSVTHVLARCDHAFTNNQNVTLVQID